MIDLLTVSHSVFQEIDDYIVQARERSYETMVNFGRQGLTIAASAAVSAAVKVLHGHMCSVVHSCTVYTRHLS